MVKFKLTCNVIINLIQELVKRYSEFINFPIYLWASKEVDVEVPADEDESSEEEESCMHNPIYFLVINSNSLVLVAESISVFCVYSIFGLTYLSLDH